ncbi:helix-turn-helix domain-containing protein [Bacillus cereus]|uniref:helix-turn-helix domain-containing protein n=1 Tax=Bacillus cereus TaxID=1396 RepID=UPI0012FCA642|nr:helix-turn-helix domain-containing protein [Bacillus cereus]
MESEFLVKINGEGQTLESIAALYLGLIEEGFNMTIDEMADYLSCSYDYVQKNIAPYVHHIYINPVASKALVTHAEEREHIGLFTKRKLFSRQGFEEFILNESILLRDRERYYLNELSFVAIERLVEMSKNQEKNSTTSKMYETIALQQVKSLYSEAELKDKVVREFMVGEFPVKLYSLKDLLDGIEDLNISFRYKVMVYRYLKQQGIPKMKIQSLIRYRREDLESIAVFSLPLVVDKKKILSWVEKILK